MIHRNFLNANRISREHEQTHSHFWTISRCTFLVDLDPRSGGCHYSFSLSPSLLFPFSLSQRRRNFKEIVLSHLFLQYRSQIDSMSPTWKRLVILPLMINSEGAECHGSGIRKLTRERRNHPRGLRSAGAGATRRRRVNEYASTQWYETTCVATPPALAVAYVLGRATAEGELDRAPETAFGRCAACSVWWRPLSPATRTATTTTTTPTPTPLAATMARRRSRRSALISPTPPATSAPASFHLASIPFLPPPPRPVLHRPSRPPGRATPHYSIDPTGEALWCVPFAWFERRLQIALA